jgi:PncC family amidohydrolase
MDDDEGASPAARLGALLAERGQTLAVAEGATGGWLSHLLTSVPGSSAWFRAGVVAYTNYPKQLLFRVSRDTIDERGAISAEATVQMARLARRLFDADWSLAVTGYADASAPSPVGPVPGAPASNPEGVPRIESEGSAPRAGLTFVAVSSRAGTPQGDSQSWEEWELPAPSREAYKHAAATAALELLLKSLQG